MNFCCKGDKSVKKYSLIFIVIIMSILLLGCTDAKTMEDVFHKEMKSLKDVDDYTLIEKVENDGVILFTFLY
jgi:outer membrane lipoprotein-sorting protein